MKPSLEYRFNRVAHYYGTHRALEIKSLDIAKGSITGLAGPNGSGKSTLLKLMTFAERPTRGEILFNGKPEQLFSPNVRFKISLLTQKPYLLKRSVFDNTVYGLKIRGTKDNLKAKVSGALSKVGLTFDGFAQRQWHELSGGEAQRVALAARLALCPQVLLLDEPTASVDLESAQLIRQAAFAARKEWGTTLVIASHDRQWLDEISETTLYLFKGKIMKPGMHTMLTGPWAQHNNGLSSTPLGNGQLFVAPAPPGKNALGLIDNLDIHVEVERPAIKPPFSNHCAPINGSGVTNRLKGIVTHLMLDRKTSRIAATIQVGDFIFTPLLDRGTVTSLALYPGSQVIISIGSNHLTWI